MRSCLKLPRELRSPFWPWAVSACSSGKRLASWKTTANGRTIPPLRVRMRNEAGDLAYIEKGMHIIAHGRQIRVAATVHNQTLASAAEPMPNEFVPPIGPAGVSAQKPLHALHEVGLGRLDHQKKRQLPEARSAPKANFLSVITGSTKRR